MNLIEWIQGFINFPDKYEFLLYLAGTAVLLLLLIITIDFFCSIFFAIFKRR